MNNSKRWGQLIAGALMMLFSGVVYAWSVLSVPIAKEAFVSGGGKLSFTFTLCLCFFCVGGLTSGLLSKKVSFRLRLIFSAAAFALGLYVASRCQTLMEMWIGFGAMGGFASGMAYNVIISTVVGHFPDRRGLASGILLMAFGSGSFLIGTFYASLSATMGWRAFFVALGLATAAVLVLGALCLRSAQPAGNAGAAVQVEGSTPGEMMSSVALWVFLAWVVLMSAAGLAVISQSAGCVMEAVPGTAGSVVATIAGLMSVFNGVGRVAFGALYDRIGYRKNMVLNTVCFIAALGVVYMGIRSGSLTMMAVGYVCFGLANGGVTPNNTAVVLSFWGPKHYSVNLSIVNLQLLVSSFGGTVAGMLRDSMGSYVSVVFAALAVTLVALPFAALLKPPAKRA